MTWSMESSARSWVRRVGAEARKPESLTSSTVSPMDSTCPAATNISASMKASVLQFLRHGKASLH